ncbi:hypothetical protein OAI46_07410 [Alphaproteobacteria bacterium]|nr:hypothetical protein [Alphaproteobacteria bacterium]
MNKIVILSFLLTSLYAPHSLAEVSGVFSVGAQYVMPSSGTEDSDFEEGGQEFEKDVFGIEAYSGLHIPIDETKATYIDMRFDYHEETDDGSSYNEEYGMYFSLGAHYLWNVNDNPTGIFGAVATGNSLEEEDDVDLIYMVGVEKRFGDFSTQIGYAMSNDIGNNSSDIDTLENLIFIRTGYHKDGFNGSIAYGDGDFDDDTADAGDKNDGHWIQVEMSYERPWGEHLNWYAGYEYDDVRLDAVPGEASESAKMHRVSFGIKVPFGDISSPFTTPNLTAPITWSGELN